MAENAVASGAALKKFRELVAAQGGDLAYVDDLTKLPTAKYIESVSAANTGFIQKIDAREVGETAVDLGAGRLTKQDKIDPAVGITILHKVGDAVKAGEELFIIHANQPDTLESAKNRVLAAHKISSEPCAPMHLFYGVVE